MILNRSIYKRLFVAAMMAIATVSSCRDEIQFSCFWPASPIAIDGNGVEWRGKLAYLDENIDVGFANDSNFLYLNLSSADRHIQMMLLASGLEVWFLPRSKKGKPLGIEFPIAPERPMQYSADNDIAPILESANTALQILEKRNREGKYVPVTSAAEIGIEAKLGMESRRLTYELKVPLHRGDKTPYAVDPGVDSCITVSLATPEQDNLASRRASQENTQEQFNSNNLTHPTMGMGQAGQGGGMHHQGMVSEGVSIRTVVLLATKKGKTE